MLLRFTKMHGLGNDFMLVDLISQNARMRDDQIRALADRRTGIGFDQLLLVEPPRNPQMDFRYRIFNADGTEAEQCGNGARCFARFVRDRGLTAKTEIRLETNTGDISVKLEKDGNLTVNMGAPRLAPEQIPFVAPGPMIQHEVDLRPPLPGCSSLPDRVCLTVVNIGNPHAVLNTRDVSSAPVTTLAPLVQDCGRFPEGVNVGFMEIVSRSEIRLRVFERGVGETRACGTGACAAVVAGRLQGKLDEAVTVNLPGGALSIKWPGDRADIQMTGGASRVYEGRLQI